MKGIMLTHGHKSYPCHGFRPNSWTTDTDCSRASQRVCPYPLCLSHHSTDHIIGLILWCTCRKRVFLNATRYMNRTGGIKQAGRRTCPYPLCLSRHSTATVVVLILCICRYRVFMNTTRCVNRAARDQAS
jgi:hypothetical protein